MQSIHFSNIISCPFTYITLAHCLHTEYLSICFNNVHIIHAISINASLFVDEYFLSFIYNKYYTTLFLNSIIIYLNKSQYNQTLFIVCLLMILLKISIYLPLCCNHLMTYNSLINTLLVHHILQRITTVTFPQCILHILF